MADEATCVVVLGAATNPVNEKVGGRAELVKPPPNREREDEGSGELKSEFKLGTTIEGRGAWSSAMMVVCLVLLRLSCGVSGWHVE